MRPRITQLNLKNTQPPMCCSVSLCLSQVLVWDLSSAASGRSVVTCDLPARCYLLTVLGLLFDCCLNTHFAHRDGDPLKKDEEISKEKPEEVHLLSKLRIRLFGMFFSLWMDRNPKTVTREFLESSRWPFPP